MGDTERSATDCKRDRRIKKKHQKNKAKMQEKKLKEKVRQAGAKPGTGKLDRSSTMKVIEKAVKSGQVKLVSGILVFFLLCIVLYFVLLYTTNHFYTF